MLFENKRPANPYTWPHEACRFISASGKPQWQS